VRADGEGILTLMAAVFVSFVVVAVLILLIRYPT
jgi:hypothetical protein